MAKVKVMFSITVFSYRYSLETLRKGFFGQPGYTRGHTRGAPKSWGKISRPGKWNHTCLSIVDFKASFSQALRRLKTLGSSPEIKSLKRIRAAGYQEPQIKVVFGIFDYGISLYNLQLPRWLLDLCHTLRMSLEISHYDMKEASE